MKKLFVGGVVVALLIIFSMTGCGKDNEKIAAACLANQRTLMGAVEMYNMDSKEGKISEFQHSMALEGSILVKQHYLRSPLKLPDEKCRYKSQGDLSKDGIVYCEVHDDLKKMAGH